MMLDKPCIWCWHLECYSVVCCSSHAEAGGRGRRSAAKPTMRSNSWALLEANREKQLLDVAALESCCLALDNKSAWSAVAHQHVSSLAERAGTCTAHLLGAAWSGCLGVEEQHQRLALKAGEGHSLAVTGLEHPERRQTTRAHSPLNHWPTSPLLMKRVLW